MLNRNWLSNCCLCPRQCGADRLHGEIGVCGAGSDLIAARAALHFWEEPCISGERGSGAVFFSHCPLQCAYCQNRSISAGGSGIKISVRRLSDIFFELEKKGAHNINLVTPTHYAAHIAEVVRTAKVKGLSLPIVYNCSGYENPDAICELEDIVDIYLIDFKYMDDAPAVKYSNAPHYSYYAKSALSEMVRQKKAVFDAAGIMKSGVIVRHLMLPGFAEDSKKIVRYIAENYGDSVYVSLMNQYTPPACAPAELKRTITATEYDELIEYALSLGVQNGFIQEEGTQKESFIPEFNGEGVLPSYSR